MHFGMSGTDGLEAFFESPVDTLEKERYHTGGNPHCIHQARLQGQPCLVDEPQHLVGVGGRSENGREEDECTSHDEANQCRQGDSLVPLLGGRGLYR